MKNEKKLLMVINADWYFDLHWMERAINATENGYEVHLALPSCKTDILNTLTKHGIIVHYFDMDRSSLSIKSSFRAIQQLYRIFKSVRPQLVHSVTIKPNLYSSLITRVTKTPLISTYAGLGTLKVSDSLKHKIARKIIFSVLRHSTRKNNNILLFENEEDLIYFKNLRIGNNNQRKRVFGAGVNLEKYAYSDVIEEKNTKFTVLFASRLLKNKGLNEVMYAVNELKDSGLPIDLQVAGIFDHDSPFAYEKKEIESFSSKGLIDWLGQRDDIPELIKSASVIALPTQYGEGVPRILIEACAIGRPIITSQLGGCRDICKNGENGFIVNPPYVESIKSAIKTLYLNRKLINNMGRKGREIVVKEFSNDIILSQNIDFYRSLLNTKSD
ncbi:glycosyltransferase family 4 protein [Vibrio breoganii]|uniref:glycosyltransferase family 4 protein n=1 Tax=Vibrio breoganii TaxID=553239 RepID=UPI000C82DFD1|nr:glycosyltransferase family 4 protein [Vibrio breoganii]PMM15179.1 hypothetical protein BCT59_17365 [Vibrio breoganii]